MRHRLHSVEPLTPTADPSEQPLAKADSSELQDVQPSASRQQKLGRLLGGVLAVAAVYIAVEDVIPGIQLYNSAHGPAPSGPSILQSEVPSTTLPTNSGVNSSTAPKGTSETNTLVAPGIDLVRPSMPKSVTYVPLRGKSETFGIGTTQVETKRKVSNGVLTVLQSVDPELVYCPGSHPKGIDKPKFAKTTADCNKWYQVTDYGVPHTGPWPADVPGVSAEQQDEPLVLSAHTSNRGNALSGNIIRSIKGGKFIVKLVSGATLTYAIEPQHIYARKGTADLPESIKNTPETSIIVFTCLENNDGSNDVVRADLIAASAS